MLLTTQYLDEADKLANRVAVLDRGRLVAEGTPEELKHRVNRGHVELRFPGIRELDVAARALDGYGGDDDELTLQVPGDGDVRSLRALLDRFHRESIEVESLAVHTPDLDDVFLALTGRQEKELLR